MKIIASLEVSCQIIAKHGMFYAQIFDCESLNLIFEEECMTHSGAANRIASFISECLIVPVPKEK